MIIATDIETSEPEDSEPAEPLVQLNGKQLDELAAKMAEIMFGSAWMSTEQVCAWLSIRRDYLYDMVARGRIPHVKIGRLLRFKRSELEAWVEEHRQ